jgi:uncharacterized RDD family membrane protein YckC
VTVIPANLGKRAAATIFDLVLFYIPYLMTQSSWVPDPLRVVAAVAVLVVLGAQARLLTREGRTYGKRRWGLRVVARATGVNAGFLVNVVVRAGVTWVPSVLMMAESAFPLWLFVDLGVLLWRKDRRSLHDLIARTEVVEETVDIPEEAS